jgi:hypothetical protein
MKQAAKHVQSRTPVSVYHAVISHYGCIKGLYLFRGRKNFRVSHCAGEVLAR